jgi:hypothetical protein
MKIAPNTPIFLGDSVYCVWDGYMLKLYIDNGFGPQNEIFLEPEVQIALTEIFEAIVNQI